MMNSIIWLDRRAENEIKEVEAGECLQTMSLR